MMMRQVVAGAALGSLLFIAGCGSGYDDDIDQVIEMENEQLREGGGPEENVTNIDREETGVEVFEEGQYIRLTYDIRPNDTITSEYQRDGEIFSRASDYETRQYLTITEAEYTENMEE